MLAYAAVASAWIAGSDAMLVRLGLEPGASATAGMLKGLIFVAVTASVLQWRLGAVFTGLESARRKLAEARERFRRAIVDAPIPAMIFAQDGEILLTNRAWFDITGYEARELTTVSDWTARAYPGRGREVDRFIAGLFAIERPDHEPDTTVRIRDGSTRFWSFSTSPLGSLPDGRKLRLSMALDVTERRRAEDALRASEERFRALVESAPDGIVIESEGRLAYINPEAVSLFGAEDASELLGTPVVDRFLPEHRPAMAEQTRIAVEQGKPAGLRELILLRPDGEAVDVELSAVPFRRDDSGDALVFVRDIRARKSAEAALNRSSEQLRDLTRRILEVQESERRHLARELHDEIGQSLTAIKLDLQTVRLKPEAMADRLEDAVTLLDSTLGQVRNLALDLRPSILDDLGLVVALHWYVDRFRHRSTIEGTFTSEPAEVRVPPEVATACFRGVQEALTNLARHSGASRFSVSLRHWPGGVELSIQDDGSGFDPGSLPPGRGLGLRGMRERVEQAGGHLALESSPGAGTEVRLTFPVEGGAER